ncbi:hypothetical protein FBQ96_00735 [Nitrospirales bacterium NOB]|nr:hypothetical protein [Nitrospirota bacterium]MCE7965039.1 hypothetical protein [Nitrospira sp. NTP2]MCK6492836.1 hypothetical protein [Nitrospira sp.]MDL1888106.1 hypothetical protein [Nitrospirales bacterium NOB]MEB2337892.1 hypothetical protein [Nitrospirales bacterium]
MLAPTAQCRELELVGLIDAQTPRKVMGDPGRIRQVLRIDDDPTSVTLRFEIIDTGIGLSLEAQAKMSTCRGWPVR